jgi:hypothetical protein
LGRTFNARTPQIKGSIRRTGCRDFELERVFADPNFTVVSHGWMQARVK